MLLFTAHTMLPKSQSGSWKLPGLIVPIIKLSLESKGWILSSVFMFYCQFFFGGIPVFYSGSKMCCLRTQILAKLQGLRLSEFLLISSFQLAAVHMGWPGVGIVIIDIVQPPSLSTGSIIS